MKDLLEKFWSLRPVRIVVGVCMIAVGIIGLLPLLPGGLLFLPGLIIIMREFAFTRRMIAWFLITFPRVRRLLSKARVWLHKKTGMKITFSHPDK